MKIYVLDNGGQWTHREWRVLKYLGVDAEIISNTTPPEDVEDGDGFLLSGGAPRIGSEADMLGASGEYLRRADRPVLGICVGCQFIATYFGGTAGPADTPEYGKTEITIDNADTLFDGLPGRITVWESHNDEIKSLPPVLEGLAHSDNCRFQAVRHKNLPIFGVQFHPEVEHTERGMEIFRNFLEECRR